MAKIMLNGVDYSAPVASGGADKNIYGDTFVSMGRRAGTTVGENSFVFGEELEATNRCAVCLGGYNNQAYGEYSAIVGGVGGMAHGIASVTFGGYHPSASGNESAVIAGYISCADGRDSVALGGKSCCANGDRSATLGGDGITSDNYASAVSGKHNRVLEIGGDENNQVGDAFVIGNGTLNYSSNALRVTYLGDVLGTKAFQSSGADYAEFVKPWWDGNIYDEDRVGYFVTAKDGLLYKADEGDYIIGITSGNPSVVGNADEDYYWRYERDEFNRIVMEDVPEMKIKTETVRMIVQKTETKIEYVQPDDEDWDPEYDKEGNPVPNEIPYEATVFDDDGNPVMEEIEEICPVKDERTGEYVMEETGKIIKNARMKLAEDYDPSMQDSYVPRADRPEWDYVGMVGVLPVRDDGTCVPGQFCKCGGDGIATLSAERGFDTYMVLDRISDNIVSVILK